MTNVPDRDLPRNDYSADPGREIKPGGNSTLWIVVAVAAVLILAVGWYGYRHNTSAPALTNDSATQQTAPAPTPAPAPTQAPQ